MKSISSLDSSMKSQPTSVKRARTMSVNNDDDTNLNTCSTNHISQNTDSVTGSSSNTNNSTQSRVVNEGSAIHASSTVSQAADCSSTSSPNSGDKPLVALLDARSCSSEMAVLRGEALVAFCDAKSVDEVHEKVLNEACSALVWGTMELGREELVKFKALKHLVRLGANLDNIDVRAAGELGIAVSNVPHCSIGEIADSTMSMILELYRKTSRLSYEELIEGNHPNSFEQLRETMRGTVRINGQKLGIVGLGRVGICVARRALPFGFRVGFYDPNLDDGVEIMFGIHRYQSLNDLLVDCDCITLHCSLNSETLNMLNEKTFPIMKKGCFVVNTASPSLIDEKELVDALTTGKLRGAAMDVHEPGPSTVPEAHLLDCPNLIVCPRSAWYSDEACEEVRVIAAQEVKRGLTGTIPRSLRYCVNAHHLQDVFNNRTNRPKWNWNQQRIALQLQQQQQPITPTFVPPPTTANQLPIPPGQQFSAQQQQQPMVPLPFQHPSIQSSVIHALKQSSLSSQETYSGPTPMESRMIAAMFETQFNQQPFSASTIPPTKLTGSLFGPLLPSARPTLPPSAGLRPFGTGLVIDMYKPFRTNDETNRNVIGTNQQSSFTREEDSEAHSDSNRAG